MFLTTMSWVLNDMELYLVVSSNMAVVALIMIRAGHPNRIRLQPYTIQVIDRCKPSHLRTICSSSRGFDSTVTVS